MNSQALIYAIGLMNGPIELAKISLKFYILSHPNAFSDAWTYLAFSL